MIGNVISNCAPVGVINGIVRGIIKMPFLPEMFGILANILDWAFVQPLTDKIIELFKRFLFVSQNIAAQSQVKF